MIAPRLVAPARARRRAARRPLRRRGRQARPRERDPQPGPHGRDRGGADDRARARHVRRRLRQGLLAIDENDAREAGRHEPRRSRPRAAGTTVPGRRRRRLRASAPGVELASSIRGDRAQLIGGGEVDVSGVDPATIGRAYRFDWSRGLGRGARLARRPTARSCASGLDDDGRHGRRRRPIQVPDAGRQARRRRRPRRLRSTATSTRCSARSCSRRTRSTASSRGRRTCSRSSAGATRRRRSSSALAALSRTRSSRRGDGVHRRAGRAGSSTLHEPVLRPARALA